MNTRLRPLIWTAAALGLSCAFVASNTSGAKAPALSEGQIKSLRQRLVTHYPKTHHLLDALSQYQPDTYVQLLQQVPKLTEQREASALAFAREHHDELATLIERLRDRKSKAYHSAIRSLLNDAERLMRIQQRDPKAYPDELALWKNQSKVRLLAAKMARKKKTMEALEKQMRDLLAEQAGVKRRLAERQKKRLEAQLKRVDKRLDETEQAFVERELKRYRPKPPAASEKPKNSKK